MLDKSAFYRSPWKLDAYSIDLHHANLNLALYKPLRKVVEKLLPLNKLTDVSNVPIRSNKVQL